MSVDPVLVVYGVVVARAVYDRYGARIASEYDVLQRRLRRFSRRVARAANGAVAKAAGARDVESALRDLGDVNAALARLATGAGIGDGWRPRAVSGGALVRRGKVPAVGADVREEGAGGVRGGL